MNHESARYQASPQCGAPCDSQRFAAGIPADLQAWLDAPAVGREFGCPDYDKYAMTTPDNPLFEKYVKDLQARFPYQFSGAHLGVELGAGWADVFQRLCEDVDAVLGDDKRGFHWLQVKEKWGSAKFYFALEPGEADLHLDLMGETQVTTVIVAAEPDKRAADVLQVRKSLLQLTSEAEEETQRRCVVCGEPGQISRHGWFMTLCDAHMKARDKEGLPTDYWIYFENAP